MEIWMTVESDKNQPLLFYLLEQISTINKSNQLLGNTGYTYLSWKLGSDRYRVSNCPFSKRAAYKIKVDVKSIFSTKYMLFYSIFLQFHSVSPQILILCVWHHRDKFHYHLEATSVWLELEEISTLSGIDFQSLNRIILLQTWILTGCDTQWKFERHSVFYYARRYWTSS